MNEDDLLFLGLIIKTKGLGGSMKFVSGPSLPDFPPPPFEVFLSKHGKWIPFNTLRIKTETHDLLLTLQGVTSIEQAMPLIGFKLYVHKNLVKTQKKGFTYLDLVGYQLRDELEGTIGCIEEVLTLPQQWIGVIHAAGAEILIPLNDDLILSIDHAAQMVHCRLPDGLLDIYRA